MVWASATFCSLSRAVVEAPFEQAKVMRQTGQSWSMAELYRGSGMQAARTTGLLLMIFGPIDIIRTKTSWMTSIFNQWIITTGVCGAAYAIVWPLEVSSRRAMRTKDSRDYAYTQL